jgi:hypothetical protein
MRELLAEKLGRAVLVPDEPQLVGDTTNMLDIVTSMQLADKVINI